MHLIEGAKWSDGAPFNADDVMFYWDDNLSDPNVKPLNSNGVEAFGVGTTLKKVDDNTVLWTFKDAFPKQYLYAMAYQGGFCPGPAHILKPQHPKYSKNTYEQYANAFPRELPELPGDGCLGAGRVSPGRRHRAAPQPVLLEGGRARATSCPTSTRSPTACRPGPIATCRQSREPATSPTSSSLKAMSRR